MILAKNKNGQIGRQVPGQGLQARVALPDQAERRGNVYVSTRSIAEDEAYYGGQEKLENAKIQAEKVRRVAQRQADIAKRQEYDRRVASFQRLAKVDPMNEKLKKHFSRLAGMGECQRMAEDVVVRPAAPTGTYSAETSTRSVLSAPANFSAEGGNPEIVRSKDGKRPIVWRSDFRQHEIVGNPLTRDGRFGPAMTDYDRYVCGEDVNQTDVVDMPIAGGTILGRYCDQNIPTGKPVKNDQMGAMGFDWSWSGITDWAGGVVDQTVDKLEDQLPDQLAKEIQNAVTGGGQVTQSGGGTVTITRPITGAVNTVSQTVGLPPWAIYTGVGLLGVGVLFMMIKAIKS